MALVHIFEENIYLCENWYLGVFKSADYESGINFSFQAAFMSTFTKFEKRETTGEQSKRIFKKPMRFLEDLFLKIIHKTIPH